MHTLDVKPIHREEFDDEVVYSASYVKETPDGVMYDIFKQTNGGAASSHKIIFGSPKEFETFKLSPKIFWDAAEYESKGFRLRKLYINVIENPNDPESCRLEYRLGQQPYVDEYDKFGVYHVIGYTCKNDITTYEMIVLIKSTDTLSKDEIDKIKDAVKFYVQVTNMVTSSYKAEKDKNKTAAEKFAEVMYEWEQSWKNKKSEGDIDVR